MPEQILNIVLSERLNEQVEGKVLPQQTPVTLQNVIHNVDGKLEKRGAFRRVTQLSLARTPMRGLYATKRELLAQSYDELWGWVENELVFLKRGMVAPCHVKTEEAFSDASVYWSSDMAGPSEHQLLASVRTTQYVGGPNWAVISHGNTDDDHNLFKDGSILSGATRSARPWGVKSSYSLTVASTYMAVSLKGDTTPDTAAELKIYRWTDALNQQAPLLRQTVTSNLFYDHVFTGVGGTIDDQVRNHRTFSVEGLPALVSATSGYVVVWIDDTSRDMELRRYDDGDVQQATATHTPADPLDDFYRVATAISKDGASLHVLHAWEDDSTGDHVVTLHTRALTTLALTFSTELQRKSGAGYFDNLGVVEGTFEGEERICCVWLERESNGNALQMRTRSVNLTHGDADALSLTPNCAPYAGPFAYNGRIYVAATIGCCEFFDAALGVEYGTRGWNTNVLLDIEYDSAATTRPILIASMFDVFSASVLGIQVASTTADLNTAMTVAGNCNNVVDLGNGKFSFLSPVLSKWYPGYNELLTDAPDTARLGAEIRPAVHRTTVDFKYKSHMADAHGDFVVIGGGYVVFYNGYECMELGFPVVPYIYRVTSNNFGFAALEDGDYFVSTHWEMIDMAGFLHRGAPSPTSKIEGVTTTPNDQNTIEYTCYTYPCTHRTFGFLDVASFIEHGSTAPSRAKPLGDITRNSDINRYTTNYVVSDKFFEVYKEPRYDLGGDVEAVAPEGARIPTIALDRLFLGDMARRSRFQFSDPFVPGTATETKVAPEFNEGFGKLLPTGGDITAQAEMDDKYICWTRSRVYMLAGTGPDNAGRGNDFPPLTLVSAEVGCIESRSVVKSPLGLHFRSLAGIQLLDRGLAVHYFSGPVEQTLKLYPNTEGAAHWESKQAVVWAVNDGSNYRLIVHDYESGQWYVWHVKDGDGADLGAIDIAVWNDELYVLTSDGYVYKYDDAFRFDGYDNTPYINDDPIEFRVKFAWLQAGWMRVKEVTPLWESKGDAASNIHVDLYQDFDTVPFQQETISNLNTYEDPDERAQPKIRPTRQKCQAFTCEIYDSKGGSLNGIGPRLIGIRYKVMPKRGTPKLVKDQRK